MGLAGGKQMSNQEFFTAAHWEATKALEMIAELRQKETTPKESAAVLQHLNKALCAWQEFHNRTCGHEPAKHGV